MLTCKNLKLDWVEKVGDSFERPSELCCTLQSSMASVYTRSCMRCDGSFHICIIFLACILKTAEDGSAHHASSRNIPICVLDTPLSIYSQLLPHVLRYPLM